VWKCIKCGREFKNTNQDHYCGEKPAGIDEYIAAQSEEIRPILVRTRETIRKAAPDAIEKISWNMPTFWQGENLIHFAAFKNHLGIYPGDLTLSPFEERLAGYKKSKGAIQFAYEKPIDYELIADITSWRVSCVACKSRGNIEMETSRMKRKVCDMPDYIAEALEKSGLWERYRERPPYQRNDYVRWIARAKREETRRKRLAQMLEELQTGGVYMKMEYNTG